MSHSRLLKPEGKDIILEKIIDPNGKGWGFYVLVCFGLVLLPVLV